MKLFPLYIILIVLVILLLRNDNSNISNIFKEVNKESKKKKDTFKNTTTNNKVHENKTINNKTIIDKDYSKYYKLEIEELTGIKVKDTTYSELKEMKHIYELTNPIVNEKIRKKEMFEDEYNIRKVFNKEIKKYLEKNKTLPLVNKDIKSEEEKEERIIDNIISKEKVIDINDVIVIEKNKKEILDVINEIKKQNISIDNVEEIKEIINEIVPDTVDDKVILNEVINIVNLEEEIILDNIIEDVTITKDIDDVIEEIKEDEELVEVINEEIDEELLEEFEEELSFEEKNDPMELIQEKIERNEIKIDKNNKPVDNSVFLKQNKEKINSLKSKIDTNLDKELNDYEYEALSDEVTDLISELETYLLVKEVSISEYNEIINRINTLKEYSKNIKQTENKELKNEVKALDNTISEEEKNGVLNEIDNIYLEHKLELKKYKINSLEELNNLTYEQQRDIEKELISKRLNKMSRALEIKSILALPFIRNKYFAFFTAGLFVHNHLKVSNGILNHTTINKTKTDLSFINRGTDALFNATMLNDSNLGELNRLKQSYLTKYPELSNDQAFINRFNRVEQDLNANQKIINKKKNRFKKTQKLINKNKKELDKQKKLKKTLYN